MALETLKKLSQEAPLSSQLIPLVGWIAAARSVLPKLVDLALAVREGDDAKIKQAMYVLENCTGKMPEEKSRGC